MKNEISVNTEDRQQDLTDKDIFLKIWFSPRSVLRYINEKQYDKYVIILLIISGIVRSFDRAVAKDMGDNMSVWFIIGLCIFAGGLFGWISFYIYAFLLSWTGKWLKGEGGTRDMLRIAAYAMIPSIFTLLLLFIQIALWGEGVFMSEGPFASEDWASIVLSFVFLLLELILIVWTIVFYVVGISEVQKFSLWKSVLNMLLPGLMLLSIIGGIALIIGAAHLMLN